LDAEFGPVTRAVESFSEAVEQVFRDAMNQAGYRLHARSVWRKKRRQPMNATTPTTESTPPMTPDEFERLLGKRAASAPTPTSKPAPAPPALTMPPVEDEREQLETQLIEECKRADKGDHQARAALDERLDFFTRRDGSIGLLAAKIGIDPSASAEAAFIKALHGDQYFTSEILRRRLAELRHDLAGPNPTPLEQLLVDRVVLLHAVAAECDRRLFCAWRSAHGILAKMDIEYHGAASDAAHKRLAAAMKSLTTARAKLAPMQVTVSQTVNVERPALPEASEPQLSIGEILASRAN
jgi:hypothetical protein